MPDTLLAILALVSIARAERMRGILSLLRLELVSQLYTIAIYQRAFIRHKTATKYVFTQTKVNHTLKKRLLEAQKLWENV